MKILAVTALACVAAVAQTPERVQIVTAPEVGVTTMGAVSYQRNPGTGAGADVIGFIGAEMSAEKPIKGAPYSATTVNETVQTLADGTHITRRVNGAVYRDSEGRVRREQTIENIGPWSTSSEPFKLITITDPVSNQSIILDSRNKTARKIQIVAGKPGMAFSTAGAPAEGTRLKMVPRKTFDVTLTSTAQMEKQMAELSTLTTVRTEDVNTNAEQLGRRIIEGVPCDGERTVSVVPVGKIGNDREIQSTNERWYSPDLQLAVLTTHSDPRVGESSFKLTGISRSEPSPSLFTVPSDYTVEEAPNFYFNKRVEPPPPPPAPAQ